MALGRVTRSGGPAEPTSPSSSGNGARAVENIQLTSEKPPIIGSYKVLAHQVTAVVAAGLALYVLQRSEFTTKMQAVADAEAVGRALISDIWTNLTEFIHSNDGVAGCKVKTEAGKIYDLTLAGCQAFCMKQS